MVICTGEREIGAVFGRLTDNPGKLACTIIIFRPQYMSNQYMRLLCCFWSLMQKTKQKKSKTKNWGKNAELGGGGTYPPRSNPSPPVPPLPPVAHAFITTMRNLYCLSVRLRKHLHCMFCFVDAGLMPQYIFRTVAVHLTIIFWNRGE